MTQAAQPIQKAKANLPVSYNEELAAEALAMKARIGAPSGDLIRVNKDKTFSLPSGDTAPVLAGVVVSFVTMNQYYEGKYDAKNPVPPVCVAIGQEIKSLKPFGASPKIQNADCLTCWANQWKSDPHGNGKACKNQRLLAILAPNLQEDGPLMLLKISPTGTRFWDAYVNTVLTLTDGPPIKVITEIFFDEREEYASLRFKVQGLNDNIGPAFARRGQALDRLMREPDFAPPDVKPQPKAS